MWESRMWESTLKTGKKTAMEEPVSVTEIETIPKSKAFHIQSSAVASENRGAKWFHWHSCCPDPGFRSWIPANIKCHPQLFSLSPVHGGAFNAQTFGSSNIKHGNWKSTMRNLSMIFQSTFKWSKWLSGSSGHLSWPVRWFIPTRAKSLPPSRTHWSPGRRVSSEARSQKWPPKRCSP